MVVDSVTIKLPEKGKSPGLNLKTVMPRNGIPVDMATDDLKPLLEDVGAKWI